LATWNVQTMNDVRWRTLEEFGGNADIAVFTDLGRSSWDTVVKQHEGGRFIVSDRPAEDETKCSGVGIKLSARVASRLMQSGKSGSRIVWLRLRGATCNLLVFGVYLPHKGLGRRNREVMDELTACIAAEKKGNDCLLVGGDVNGELGKLAKSRDGVQRTGRYSIAPETDREGELTLGLMETFDLFASSTDFAQSKQSNKGTGEPSPSCDVSPPSSLPCTRCAVIAAAPMSPATSTSPSCRTPCCCPCVAPVAALA
jgi:hypothetical protein